MDARTGGQSPWRPESGRLIDIRYEQAMMVQYAYDI